MDPMLVGTSEEAELFVGNKVKLKSNSVEFCEGASEKRAVGCNDGRKEGDNDGRILGPTVKSVAAGVVNSDRFRFRFPNAPKVTAAKLNTIASPMTK